MAVTLSPSQTARDEVALDLKLEGADVGATVCVSKKTFLPTRASIRCFVGSLGVKFLAWRAVCGLRLPVSVNVTSGGRTGHDAVTEGEVAMDDGESTYKMPAWKATDTAFDHSKPAFVQTRRTEDGHIFVHPRVNGRDVGWFLLDTGAGGMFIDKAVAKRLGLRNSLPVHPMGAAGMVSGWLCRVRTFSLGPISVENLPFTTLDTREVSKAFRLAISGVVGYDILRRAVVSIPAQRGDVRVERPADGLSSLTPIRFESGTPLVYLECERGGGWFMLDTASSLPLTFFASFTRRAHMLEGREVEPGTAVGVGGTPALKAGRIGWASFGGNRVKDPPAVFMSSKAGISADRYLAGSIGQMTLRLFDVTLDYGGGGVTLKAGVGVDLFGDGDSRRQFQLPGPGWARIVTERAFYERDLSPGETLEVDILDPDRVVDIVSPGVRKSIERTVSPKGERVILTRSPARRDANAEQKSAHPSPTLAGPQPIYVVPGAQQTEMPGAGWYLVKDPDRPGGWIWLPPDWTLQRDPGSTEDMVPTPPVPKDRGKARE